MTGGGGLAIGLLKVTCGKEPKEGEKKFMYFPEKPRGMFSELKDLHVNPREAPGIFVASALSLSVGATVGPEAALATLGGGLGTMVGKWQGLDWYSEGTEETERRHTNTLVGMAGAMGALFPCPLLAVMLLHELALVAGRVSNHMENIILTGLAATAAWAVYTSIEPLTYLHGTNLPFAVNDLLCSSSEDNGDDHELDGYLDDAQTWIDELDSLDDGAAETLVKKIAAAAATASFQEICLSEFKFIWILYASAMGVLSGLVAFMHLITIGIFRKVGERVKQRLGQRFNDRISTLLLPVIGGVLFGLVGVGFPLTIGDGTLQLPNIINAALGDEATISQGHLIGTILLNMVAAGISQGFGFIGGQIFPTVRAH